MESKVSFTTTATATATVVPVNPTKSCIRRIHLDLKHLAQNPMHGIFVVPDSNAVNLCHAVVLGPIDTPYECGFFYFKLEFPFNYPHKPPKVTLQTTGGGRVRFNPNLYKNGKVCLSILGTWNGPSWSPVQTIGSVLLSIQSLMNENPHHNEPGFEKNSPASSLKHAKNYNHYIRHETLGIAVLDMADMALHHRGDDDDARTSFFPTAFAEYICETFLIHAEVYKLTCDEYTFLDGREFQDPFGAVKGKFRFSSLKKRIEQMEEAMILRTSPQPAANVSAKRKWQKDDS
mmetsp:Transcript_2996/g.4883  ORF Transcript_2996/g.4883 Transcript_2996/m.4883 type:complete len:289 (-) Transcript_2996:266-1132(-)|eukprot:CAMPEP_0119013458 /NCGR_PEP_ID=MMETSP1176-20130426/8459_1 /TAXON_ID=265551 /ORGANISM="Synedropsis recta cf, Strain CCMP1620" /LENGTH=288 /DNA_ID=CAMNT_0006966549 /DNA_START=96 /DNA_END=962 /DNA_ORIENTATION=+